MSGIGDRAGEREFLRSYDPGEFPAFAVTVDEPFTLADLRRVYTAVWGTAPDLGNFRRKVLGTAGFVTETERSPVAAAGPAGGRPPLLYRRGDADVLHPPMLRPPEEGAHDR